MQKTHGTHTSDDSAKTNMQKIWEREKERKYSKLSSLKRRVNGKPRKSVKLQFRVTEAENKLLIQFTKEMKAPNISTAIRLLVSRSDQYKKRADKLEKLYAEMRKVLT